MGCLVVFLLTRHIKSGSGPATLLFWCMYTEEQQPVSQSIIACKEERRRSVDDESSSFYFAQIETFSLLLSVVFFSSPRSFAFFPSLFTRNLYCLFLSFLLRMSSIDESVFFSKAGLHSSFFVNQRHPSARVYRQTPPHLASRHAFFLFLFVKWLNLLPLLSLSSSLKSSRSSFPSSLSTVTLLAKNKELLFLFSSNLLVHPS